MIPSAAPDSRPNPIPAIAGVFSVVVGALVLLGWAIDSIFLKSLVPGLISMKPNAALAFALIGGALWGLSERTETPFVQRPASGCAFAAAAIGVVTTLEYALEWNPGIDQWLFQESLTTSGLWFPGRMGLNTALCFSLFGVALLLNARKADTNPYVREGLTLGGIFLAFIALLGYLYQEKLLYGIGQYNPMALHTSLTLLVSGVGILLLRPDRGIMTVMTSEQAGGQMLRRLLPGILLVLPAIGWIRLVGEHQGLYEEALGVAIFATLATVALFVFLWWTARSLNFAAQARDLARQSRDESERRFRQLAESIREVFWLSDPAKQQVLYISPGYEAIWGRSCESLYASPTSWVEAIHPDDRERIWHAATTKQSAGTYDEDYRILAPDGSVRWIHDRAFPVLNDLGQIYRIAGIAEDVTKNKQTEAALRESEDRFEKAFRSSPHPIGITELESGICVDANDACLALFGFSREEALGTSTLDLRIWPSPGDRARFVQLLRAQGAIRNLEITLRTKQGASRQFLYSSELIDLKGTACIVTVGNDITERKLAEEALRSAHDELEARVLQRTRKLIEANRALRESDERFRQLAESIHEVFWLSSADMSQMLYISPGYEAIWGRSCESLYASPGSWVEAIHPDDRDRIRQVAITTQSVGAYDEDYRIVRPDGSVRWVHHRAFPVRNEQGQTYRIAGIAEDITDRKQAEERMRTSESFLSSVLDHLPNMVFVKEATDLRFVRFNKAGEELLGLSRDGLLGKSDYDFFPKEQADSFTDKDRTVIESRQLLDILDEPIQTKANGLRHLHTKKIPLYDDTGQPQYLVGISEDITERKQAEEELRSAYDQLRDLANRLETAREAERQKIARELHDEFGQALTGIKLDLSWLGTKLARLAPAAAGRPLVKKAQALSASVDALIDSVRETATSLRPSMLDDLGLIPALEWLAKEFRRRTGIACDLDIAPGIAHVQLTDESSTAMFRIAQELLTNVTRHAQASAVHLRLSDADEHFVLELTDNGTGISPLQITRARSLGLRGMKERAALLGGSFTITGAPGVGTTARIAIPRTSLLTSTEEHVR